MDRAELRKLCEAATGGEWCTEEFVISDEHGVSAFRIFQTLEDDPHHVTVEPGGFNPRADAQFIAAARSALPALLDEVENLEAKYDALRLSVAVIASNYKDTGDGDFAEGFLNMYSDIGYLLKAC